MRLYPRAGRGGAGRSRNTGITAAAWTRTRSTRTWAHGQRPRTMRGEQRGENGDEHGDSQTTATEPEIPAPELFKTAEAYREALLEGMAGMYSARR